MGVKLERAMGSLFSRGYRLRAIVEQLKPPVETDRAAIHQRHHPRDDATHDFSADIDLLMPCRQPHFHRRAWQEPQRRVHERAARRDVDEPRMMTGHDAGRQHAVVLDTAASPIAAPFPSIPAHNGLHRFADASNFRIRVRAVSL